MKRLFRNFPKVSGAAKPCPIVDSALMARLLIFGFLTATRLFLIAPAMATSVVALIDNANHRVVIASDCRLNRQFASHSEYKIIEAPGCDGLQLRPSFGGTRLDRFRSLRLTVAERSTGFPEARVIFGTPTDTFLAAARETLRALAGVACLYADFGPLPAR
jgi:hypothetical protein